MKYLASILVLALLVGCSMEKKDQIEQTNQSQNSNGSIYGQQLFESDFLKYADTLKFDSLKSGLINSFDIYNEASYKIAHIDAEALAEFNFEFFLPSLKRMLQKRDFNLNVEITSENENTNNVSINGEKIKLYTKEELDKENFWELTSRNFFKTINKQLAAKKLEESFYLLYGGNDLHVLLLTANQYKIISDRYKDETKEIPYLP